jgi:hypothetical protein
MEMRRLEDLDWKLHVVERFERGPPLARAPQRNILYFYNTFPMQDCTGISYNTGIIQYHCSSTPLTHQRPASQASLSSPEST